LLEQRIIFFLLHAVYEEVGDTEAFIPKMHKNIFPFIPAFYCYSTLQLFRWNPLSIIISKVDSLSIL